jgi:RimJ/RimL family protein N-acetyltransferase
MIIRQVQTHEIDLYVKHLLAHMSESGLNGNIVYTPYPRGYVHPVEKMHENLTERLNKNLNELKWGRAFVAEVDGVIVGHLDLHGHHIESSLHRCKLGMGIDSKYRGLGVGTKLMTTTIEWLKNETEIDWIDLYTFSHNLPAIKLYEKVGFKKVGMVEDLFRVDGESIHDWQMVLRIR